MQDASGFNPYKTGFVGGSDSHNTGVPYRQQNFFGGHAFNDGALKQRMSGHVFAGLDVRLENPADAADIVSAAASLAFESDQQIAILISQRMIGRKKWTETK